ELAAELAVTLPGDLDKLYFLSSGSEAVEAALKLARQYWVESGKPGKHKIIALAPAYHGNTLLALSASAREHYKTMFREWLVDVHRIPASYPYRCPCRGRDPLCPGCSGAGARVLPADSRDLRPPRSAVDRRRGPLRGWAHRDLVGDRAVRRRARHHDAGEGDLRGICAALGRRRPRADTRRDRRRLGKLPARADLLAPSRGVRRGARGGPLPQAAQAGRALRPDGRGAARAARGARG